MSRLAFALLVAVAALVGCKKPAEISTRTGNGVAVERLFTHDGCTVYRFFDSSTRYFVRCDAGVNASMSWTESCGKNCTRKVDVPTAVLRCKSCV